MTFPSSSSLNDDIDPCLSLISYSSFDDAVFKRLKLGRFALMTKTDIKSAFRLLPIHPAAFNSLGFRFNGAYYFDKCLLMGCSLLSKYFGKFSSSLEWTVSFQTGSDSLLHYLNDFLFFGPAGSADCLFLFTEGFSGFSESR